jgi:hypothetical protein
MAFGFGTQPRRWHNLQWSNCGLALPMPSRVCLLSLKDLLKVKLPRIPFAPTFWPFAGAGARLGALHTEYERQPEYPLGRSLRKRTNTDEFQSRREQAPGRANLA